MALAVVYSVMEGLTGFQRDLLVVVAGLDEPSGLDVAAEIEDYADRDVHPSQVYTNLDDLVEEGLVEKGKRDRRTNVYRLTDRGHRALVARREWEDRHL